MALLSAIEAARSMRLTPSRFIYFQDQGLIVPEITAKGVFYESEKLRGVNPDGPRELKPIKFPKEEYATPKEAMDILDISRRTFYIRINSGKIPLFKKGRYSFVLRKDLYANDDLF